MLIKKCLLFLIVLILVVGGPFVMAGCENDVPPPEEPAPEEPAPE